MSIHRRFNRNKYKYNKNIPMTNQFSKFVDDYKLPYEDERYQLLKPFYYRIKETIKKQK